jgi:TPR repeat protein
MDSVSAITVLTDEATRHDEFGRDLYISSLRQVIESAASPLVIALYGAWGSGKTSMMMRLREQLDRPNGITEPLAKTVWFDPWEHSSDDQPAVSLLYAIRKDIGLEDDVTVRHALLAIAQALATEVQVPYLGISVGKITDAYRKLADEDIEKRTQQAALRERFKDVIAAARAKAHDLPIVIFIDDLDRCQSATAVAILDALKLFFNLPGCIFVLGADRSHLEAAVQAEYRDLGITINNYLDKIIQFPFTIPALSASSVRDYIRSHTSYDLWICAPMIASAAPDNPRQLKRLINSLTFLDHIARASDFTDYDIHVMCALTLIQNAALDLYEHLRSDPVAWSDVSSLGFEQSAHEVPEWLKGMLSGSDEKVQLEVALRLLPESAREADIVPYLTLRQRFGGSYSGGSQPTYFEDNPIYTEVQSDDNVNEQSPIRPEVQRLLDESLDDFETWYRQAASGGDPVAMANLAEFLRNRGDNEEAELWYQSSAREGNVAAMSSLGDLFESRGQGEQAEDWYRRASANGDTRAKVALAGLLEARGESAEAEKFYRDAIADGDDTALPGLGRLLENRGQYDEARVWYERAAKLKDVASMAGFGRSLQREAQYDVARVWYERAALAGDKSGMVGFAGILERYGKYEDAKEWYRMAASEGDLVAMTRMADLLEMLGEYDGAETWRRLHRDSTRPDLEEPTELPGLGMRRYKFPYLS